MPRKKQVINPEQLQLVIKELETNNKFNNRHDLYKAVSTSEWGTKIGITPSVVYLRINEFNLELKTPKGKRGNALGSGVKERKPRKVPENVKTAVKKEAKYYNSDRLATKALNGSMKAAIRLNCIFCAGGNRSEIRNCEIYSCPMWIYRPLQN